MTNRRQFLHLLGGIPFLIPIDIATDKVLAENTTKPLFVWMLLRGGMDGLSVVVPYGDQLYYRKRKEIAIDQSLIIEQSTNLDGLFGLNPLIKELSTLYKNNELVIFPSIGTNYNLRSHFQAQDIIETGGNYPKQFADGWISRLLSTQPSHINAVSFNSYTPLILQGGSRAINMGPKKLAEVDLNLIKRLAPIYKDNSEFEIALKFLSAMKMNKLPVEEKELPAITAAKYLRHPYGPSIAVLEINRWDIHASNGDARFQKNLKLLNDSIQQLRINLGDAWSNTVVMVISEFGRSVSINGSGATDHGWGGTGFVFGGAVKGGYIAGDWRGLKDMDLHEARDLVPTVDMRSVVKGILLEHMQVNEASFDHIFPDSRKVEPMLGLFG